MEWSYSYRTDKTLDVPLLVESPECPKRSNCYTFSEVLDLDQRIWKEDCNQHEWCYFLRYIWYNRSKSIWIILSFELWAIFPIMIIHNSFWAVKMFYILLPVCDRFTTSSTLGQDSVCNIKKKWSIQLFCKICTLNHSQLKH